MKVGSMRGTIRQKKIAEGKLKGYWKVTPKGESGHPFKSTYYTNGTNSFSNRQAQYILSGKKSKLSVLKDSKLVVKKKSEKVVNPTPLLPNFKLISATESVKDRKYKGKYYTNGDISFSYDKAMKYAKKEITYDQLIQSSSGVIPEQRITYGMETQNYYSVGPDGVFIYLRNTNTTKNTVLITVKGRKKYDSKPKGVEQWRVPLPPTTIDSAKTPQYRKRIEENVEKLGFMKEYPIEYHITLYNKG